MYMRLDRARVLAALAALALAFVIVAILVAPRSRGSSLAPEPRASASPGTCSDLARDVDPSKVPVDSGYDPEKDVVYAHHAGRTYTMKPDDPMCRTFPGVRAVIDDTMKANAENIVVACKVMRDLVARRTTGFRGRAVDQNAAQRFVERRCGATQP